jgi:hypothetical protein
MAKIAGDFRTAPIRKELRAALEIIEKLVKTGGIDVDDVKAAYAAGVPKDGLIRAIQVCVTFSTIVRLADTFEFAIPTAEQFAKQGLGLWKRGYVM